MHLSFANAPTRAPRHCWVAALAAVATLIAGGAVASADAASAEAASAQAAPRMLSAAQLASNAPKTVIIDTVTGKIVESYLGVEPRPLITTHNICNPSDSCYVAGRTPYADQGFYGTAGTKTGTWQYRSQVLAKGRTVKACWSSQCTPTLSPYTQAVLNPQVTGTSFTIY